MTQQNKPPPLKSFRAGNVQASVWENRYEKDGETRVRYSVRIQKRYQKDENEWEKTEYYFPEDLPKLELVTRKAFAFITLKESKDIEETIPV